MKLIELWQPSAKPTISFEVYPVQEPKAALSQEKAINQLAALTPDFFSVTFGAGGSSKKFSQELIESLLKRKGQKVLAYFAGYGLGPLEISSVLTGFQEAGVENVLVVRGDKPRDQPDFKSHPESMAHASDLLAFIKPRFSFCLGAAGYPEGHIEAESKKQDLEYLKLKVEKGASFIVVNYFYDNRFFFDFVKECRGMGIDVPIIAGIMPIYNVKMMENLASLCGATITDEVRSGLAALPAGDKEVLSNFGVEFATRQCRELIKAGVAGLHFYTMNRAKSVVEIISRLRAEGSLK